MLAGKMDIRLASQVSAVRRFNRYYTREIGALRKTFLDTPWTLGEMRVLYEVAQGDSVSASEIARTLDLDPAYLSRLLRRFEADGLIVRSASPGDARQNVLKLTPLGRTTFNKIDRQQAERVLGLLGRLSAAQRRRLTAAMAEIEALMTADEPGPARSIRLRPPEAGDFGWIVSLHAEIYGREYGWGGPFEGLCARIVADYLENLDPAREACWIAEVDGERMGSVFLVTDRESGTPSVARIRLLILDPRARGLGLGGRLVAECIAFARAAGYARIVLWTHAVLVAARAIYVKAGFRKTGEETHDSWGRMETSEFYEMDLVEGAQPHGTARSRARRARPRGVDT
jgi:DNA-binding MarR family transcriptional regulator/GNAT superfamily N-acetyltransferase